MCHSPLKYKSIHNKFKDTGNALRIGFRSRINISQFFSVFVETWNFSLQEIQIEREIGVGVQIEKFIKRHDVSPILDKFVEIKIWSKVK